MSDFLKMKVKGKIKSKQFLNQKYYYILDTPAKDEYSQPSSFKVVSQQPIGEIDEVVTLDCELSGYVKHKQYTDKSTGERKTFDEANVYIHASLSSASLKKVS